MRLYVLGCFIAMIFFTSLSSYDPCNYPTKGRARWLAEHDEATMIGLTVLWPLTLPNAAAAVVGRLEKGDCKK